MRDESELRLSEIEGFSEYEYNRVTRFTPSQRGRWREHIRIDHLDHALQVMLDTNELTVEEYKQRFQNEVVTVRTQLAEESRLELTESIISFVNTQPTLRKNEFRDTNWIKEGF